MGLLDTLPSLIKRQIMEDVCGMFLKGSSPTPKFEIVDMKQYFAVNKIPPEKNGYGEIMPGIPSAFYSFANNTMGFDQTAFQTDFLKTLLSVAHETTHVNQCADWVIGKHEDRLNFLSGKKLPPELEQYIKNDTPQNRRKLQKILPDDLNHYLTMTYGYDKNPLEVEANQVARKNIKNILDFATSKAQEYTKTDQEDQQTT